MISAVLLSELRASLMVSLYFKNDYCLQILKLAKLNCSLTWFDLTYMHLCYSYQPTKLRIFHVWLFACIKITSNLRTFTAKFLLFFKLARPPKYDNGVGNWFWTLSFHIKMQLKSDTGLWILSFFWSMIFYILRSIHFKTALKSI